LLNYSAAVIPVTKADKSLDIVDLSYQPISDQDKANWEACESIPVYTKPSDRTTEYANTMADDPEVYDGAPVGVQIVGRKFEEEKVLAIADIVCKALKRVEQ